MINNDMFLLIKGCITDCQCPPGEHCVDGKCVPLYCEVEKQLGSLVHRIPEVHGQNPSVTINSSAVLSCSMPGHVFKVEGGNVGSKITVCLFSFCMLAFCS